MRRFQKPLKAQETKKIYKKCLSGSSLCENRVLPSRRNPFRFSLSMISQCQRTEFNCNFVQPSQMKSSETHILFQIAKDRFRLQFSLPMLCCGLISRIASPQYLTASSIVLCPIPIAAAPTEGFLRSFVFIEVKSNNCLICLKKHLKTSVCPTERAINRNLEKSLGKLPEIADKSGRRSN